MKMIRHHKISNQLTIILLCLITFASSAKLTYKSHDSIRQPSSDEDIKTVHLIYMNHLDVGYQSFVNNVLNEYFTQYYARAIRLARELKQGNYSETFIYTTHPWLVSLYMDCPNYMKLAGVQLQCPSAQELLEFKEAVKAGVITWHAGPMNMQPENGNSFLFRYGISMSYSLDVMFGLHRHVRVLSQRDVPGMTQSVIPLLNELGISAVSVGVNDETSPPAVPNLFRWKLGTSELIGIWHKGGYPDDPGSGPPSPGGLSKKDCAILPGCPDILCFAFRTDNTGPPMDIKEIQRYFSILRSEFPGATIKASTLEAFVSALMPYKHRLPVIMAEIGDTWIQGIASDPRKSAEYRAILRVFTNCVESGSCQYSDVRVANASRFLVKLGEHTWGLPGVYDNVNWTNKAFTAARKGNSYANCESAWDEQRAFNQMTVEALQELPVVAEIKEELAKLKPAMPDLTDYSLIADPTAPFDCGSGIKVQFDKSGGLSRLQQFGVEWAGPQNLLGKFVYRTYNESEFTEFGKLYDFQPGRAVYQKPNVSLYAQPVAGFWDSKIVEAYKNKYKPCDVLVKLQMVNQTSVTYYGAPKTIWMFWQFANDGEVDLVLQIFDKTVTRLPEALFINFSPVKQTGHRWFLSKLGNLVDSENVLLNGSQLQHGVDDDGVYYINPQTGEGFQIASYELPLACPITDQSTPTALGWLQPIAGQVTGMAFNLYNNAWDTNYIFWYPYKDEDKDFKARFKFSFTDNHADGDVLSRNNRKMWA